VPRFVTFFLIAASLLLATACSDEKSADPGVRPEDVLARTETAWKAIRSFHFRLTHENGATEIPLGLQLATAEGDYVLPDKFQADVEAKAGSVPVSVKAVAIGNSTWITNPFTRRFQRLSGVSLSDILDPSQLVSTAVASIENASLSGQESVDGVDCYRLRGQVDSAALTAALSIAEAGQVLEVELWTGVDDALPRKVRLKGPLSPDEPATITRDFRFSKFNDTVTIQPPE
jgi:hypothetical protein